jgi:hypothetical protein
LALIAAFPRTITAGSSARGANKLTAEALRIEGVSLLDCVQFGSDGCDGYFQAVTPDLARAPFRFFVLYPASMTALKLPSFNAWLTARLTFWWLEARGELLAQPGEHPNFDEFVAEGDFH